MATRESGVCDEFGRTYVRIGSERAGFGEEKFGRGGLRKAGAGGVPALVTKSC